MLKDSVAIDDLISLLNKSKDIALEDAFNLLSDTFMVDLFDRKPDRKQVSMAILGENEQAMFAVFDKGSKFKRIQDALYIIVGDLDSGNNLTGFRRIR